MIDRHNARSSANLGKPRAFHSLRQARRIGLWTLLLGACGSIVPALAGPLACDDGIKTAFHPDADTTVVAVRQVKMGEELLAPDSPKPVTAAADLCLVKLLVGPGVTAEEDSTARSYSAGIGIEVWLPTQANWNERIRNYGGGGWVGGGHRFADKIGSKVPAIVNANIGYASGTTDAGQPWYQDGSFTFLSDGKVNTEAFRDFSVRAMVEQAVKTKQLATLYYGKVPKYVYYDGHSQGGRQGFKIVQDYPELYDGYMIAAPALSIPMFGTTALYAQIVMKTDLGFSAANKTEAAAFAAKVDAANKRAVAACDKAGLGFLLNPFQCDYDPGKCGAAAADDVRQQEGIFADRDRCDILPGSDGRRRCLGAAIHNLSNDNLGTFLLIQYGCYLAKGIPFNKIWARVLNDTILLQYGLGNTSELFTLDQQTLGAIKRTEIGMSDALMRK
jgi:hypothetical protein